MAANSFRVDKYISMRGQASAPSDPVNGDMYYDTTLNKFRKYENGAWANFGGTGVSFTAVAGENLTANDAVYISTGTGSDSGRTAGRAYKLDVTNSDRIEFVGFATQTVSTAASVDIQAGGELTGFTGLSAGLPIFGSTSTTGGYQSTVPVAVGQFIIQLGIASSTTSVAINAAGSATTAQVTAAASGSSLSYAVITANQTMVKSNGYITNNASRVILTLPTTAAVGDTFGVTGYGAGGWEIGQNSGQSINKDASTTTTGAGSGIRSSQQFAGATLVCVVANTVFNVVNSEGTIALF